MQYAIEIKNLCKQYPKFALQSVSFTLPMGYIMALSEKTEQEKQPS